MKTDIQTTGTVNEVATLLIPVNGKQLVLPNVTVAEVIPYVEPESPEDAPNWYLGMFPWRNQMVPLVSYEAINEEAFVSQSRNRRIAVLNGLVDSMRLPFCGIVAEGMPRLMRVMSDELVNDEENSVGPAETARVLVSGERAAIPNVDFIQQAVVDLL